MRKEYYNFVLLILFFCSESFSQWTTTKGKNDFDGNYRAATNNGKGYEFPYLKPMIAFNLFNETEGNFYLTQVGYVGCENNSLQLKFNNDKKIYYAYPTTNNSNDILFISELFYQDKDLELIPIVFLQILESFKKNQNLSIRFENDCTKRDFKFNIAGSINALHFVYPLAWTTSLREVKKIENTFVKVEKEKKVKEEKESGEDEAKLLKEKLRLDNEEIIIKLLEKETKIFNNDFENRLLKTKPFYVNNELTESDSILFKYRFSKIYTYDPKNEFGYLENEVIGFYNYFKNDSLKINRNNKILLLNISDVPFGTFRDEYIYVKKIQKLWNDLKTSENQKIDILEAERIEKFFLNYNPQKNRTDFDKEITQILIGEDFKIDFFENPNNSKSIPVSLKKETAISILNDYKRTKIRVKLNNQVGYLSFFDLNKIAKLEKIQPFLNFWYNYYN